MIIKITSLVPSVQLLLSKYNRQRIEMKRTRLKLKKEAERFQFLDSMLFEKGEDLILPVMRLFRSVGYTKAIDADVRRNKQNEERAEDIHLFYNDNVVFCEITSNQTNSALPNNKCSVISTYLANGKDAFPDKKLFGVLISNSWWEQTDLTKRDKMPFTKKQIETAHNMGYGLTTTKQLVNGYLKVQTGEISFADFHKTITTKGLIKF